MPYYLIKTRYGLESVLSAGDGYTIKLNWYKAYPDVRTNSIAYNIYFSTDQDTVFSDGVKYASASGALTADIIDLKPGELYYFGIRPVEYNSDIFTFDDLPTAYGDLKVYPSSILRENITDTDLVIPLVDTSEFPSSGVIRIGIELIQYTFNDTTNSNLELSFLNQRGYGSTQARIHNTDGYDGYETWDPNVFYYILGESSNYDRVTACHSRFEFPEYSYTLTDGYKQVTKDLLSTDLAGSDEENINFPSYDYAGYHRTDPTLLLNGKCVGSYIGGYMFCADGYRGVGQQLRGLSFQDHNNQRQEMLLNVTGDEVVLVKRVRTGIVCACYTPHQEYQHNRCPKCFGSKFVVGREQYFNPRRSNGRILVRFSPAEDDAKMYESGIESEFSTDAWTLTVPTIKDRDILIRYDKDGNEEFRYEVLSVTRNRTLDGKQGGQKMRVQRIRKTDPLYSIRVFSDSSLLPSTINTSLSSSAGIPLHSHVITISEKITNINQINQLTMTIAGHNHPVNDGVVMPVLGHTHTIILP